MEELNIKELENIPIPDGLEGRLSDAIDHWDKAERRRSLIRRKAVAIAASLLVAAGVGVYSYVQTPSDKGTTDTYSDPKQAYRETCKAIDLLAYNLNRGINEFDKVNEKCKKVQNKLIKQNNSNN